VNIRMKVVVALALLFVVLSAVEVVVQQRLLMPSFGELEHADALTAMQRVRSALERSRDGLALAAADWGNWADAYQFSHDHNADFSRMNVTPQSLRQLQANILLIVDQTGRIVLNSADYVHTGLRLEPELIEEGGLAAEFPWRRHLGTRQPANGLLRTNLGVMMLTAAPVLNGTGGGEPRGMVIMGRLLTPARLREIAAQTRVSVAFVADPLAPVDDPLAPDADEIVETEANTEVYGAFNDVYGRHLLTLRAEVPRVISASGRKAIRYASISVVAGAVIALLVLLAILNRVVLAPLTRMTRHAVAIGEGADPGARLNFRSSDEIGVLAREFDRMVANLAATRRQLVDQSFQAGFAEQAKGVLHNIGNAMTPLGVKLRSLESRLRAAPVADVERAAAELAVPEEIPAAAAAPPAGPARRADLIAFLRLGCGEIRATVHGALEDLAVMTRQTGIVQTTLAEQMRPVQSGHVIEPVMLPDLIAQSLDIVPDSSRQRLRVDADPSLQRVGVVAVARSVLRLVLQNLIINAADAVRDAGKERGVLRVAAEIVGENGRDQLHLYCQDDGVGIPPEQLQRVFEQGYTTKSRDTNSGIGLHWCANVVASLGGRIWAVSEGRGSGAAMHLILPLGAAPRGAAPAA
jgi:sensor domain CHASE-containing protein